MYDRKAQARHAIAAHAAAPRLAHRAGEGDCDGTAEEAGLGVSQAVAVKSNPHRFAKRDDNHADIVAVYEAAGCSVIDTSHIKFGFPDAIVGLVGARGRVMDMVEFKSIEGPLTAAQVRFNLEWRGPAPRIIRSHEDAIAHIQELRRGTEIDRRAP